MPGFYLDGGVPSELIEFGLPGLPVNVNGKILEAPQGFVTKLRLLHITVLFDQARVGERGFWPIIISPTGALLTEVIGGDDYYGSNTTAAVSPLRITYANNVGTPTFTFASNPANLPDVQITILPDVWLEAGSQIQTFCQNFGGSDSISTISGVMEIREDIGRGGFGGLPAGQNVPQSLAYLLHTPGS